MARARKSKRASPRTATERLVAWGLGLRPRDVPAPVLRVARNIVADSVGCAIGGATTRKARAAVTWAKQFRTPGGSSVPGIRHRVALGPAAFAWGELINALEFDADLTPCHVAPYVLPSPWVTAERERSTGRELLVALVVAHEIAAQIAGHMPGLRVLGGTLRRPTYGFRERWSAYNAGIVGATVATARLRGLGEGSTLSALGIAAGLCPSPLSSRFFFASHPSDVKYGSPGWVSFAAITSVYLAEAGYRGDPSALVGPNGLLSVLGYGAVDLEGAANALGRRWRIRDTVFKRYPTGGVGHVGLDLFARFLQETRTPPEAIEVVEVTSEPIVGVPVLANRDVRDALDAQFALGFGFALLPYYPPGPTWQSPAALRDPRVRRLFARVRVRSDPSVVRDLYRQLVVEHRPYVHHRPTTVTVRMGGERWSATEYVAVGHPERPMPDAQLRAKFLRNCEGGPNPERSRRLWESLRKLDRASSLASLADLIRNVR